MRVLRERPQQPDPFSKRVVKADVVEDLSGMRVCWELNAQCVGRGKHFANCFQDPTVVSINQWQVQSIEQLWSEMVVSGL